MTYSCTDFADSILNAFQDQGLIVDPANDEFNDSPADQADLVLDGLDRLIQQRDRMMGALKEAEQFLSDVCLDVNKGEPNPLLLKVREALKPLEPATIEYV